MLVVIETHPVQYHAPVYRAVEQSCGVPVTAIYGSDFSVAGYRDTEFGHEFKWDTDLLSGYSSVFLSRVAHGGARTAEAASTLGLPRTLARLRPSAVLVVGYSPRFHRTAWLEARGTGAPLLFRGETADHAEDRSWVKGRLRDTALRAAYRSCARLLYIGARSRAHFERLGVAPERLVFSPYCVDTTPFEPDDTARLRLRPETRRELGLRDDQRVVLFSGKLNARKGVDLLLAAVRQLPAAVGERVVVVFLGDGEERAALDASARNSPPVTTIFVGFQNQSRLSRYYHAADLLVLPSRRAETWGLVVNEALHHGLPVVVSDRVGCAPDLVRTDTMGFVHAAGSVEGLAEAIGRALQLSASPEARAARRTQ